MTTFGIAIAAGLLSAFLATSVMLLIRHLWTSILEPWYEDRIYKDALIEGRWTGIGTFEHDEEEELLWILNRRGHAVSGTILCLTGPDQGRSYVFSGEFRNMVLTATYETADRACVDRGTVNMMLLNDGQTLLGHCSYYCPSRHQIESCVYRCHRDPGTSSGEQNKVGDS